MSVRSIEAGRAVVRITTNDDQFLRGLRAIQARLTAFGTSVISLGKVTVGVGASIAAGFVGAAKVFAVTGDNLDEMSQRTGVSVEVLSALQFAAEQTGSSVAAVGTAFKVLAKNAAAATQGNKKAKESFDAIGVSAEELIKLTPDQQLGIIADRLASIRNPTLRSAAAQKLFGRSAQELIPLLSEGSAGIRRFTQEAERLGIVMSPEAAGAAGVLNDSLDALKTQVKFLIANIGGAIVPEMTAFVERIKGTVSQSIQWIKANRQLIVLLAKATAVILGGGVAIIATGLAIRSLGAIVGILPIAFALISAGVNGVAGGFRVLVFAITALKSPIALVTLGLSALSAWFLSSTNAGAEFVGEVKAGLRGLAVTAVESFKSIGAALQRGDIAAAWNVALATMELSWVTLNQLFVSTFGDTVTDIKVALSDLQTAFAISSSQFGAVWELVANDMSFKWDASLLYMKSRFTFMFDSLKLISYEWGSNLVKGLSRDLRRLGIVGDDVVNTIDSVAGIDKEGIVNDAMAKQQAMQDEAKALSNKHANEMFNITADGQARENIIVQDGINARNKIQADGDKKIEDAKKRLAQAQAQLDNANKEAFGRNFAGEGGGNIEFAGGRKRKPFAEFEDIDMEETKRIQSEARGVFNVAALQSVAGGNSTERLIFLAEEGNKTAKDTLREIRRGGGRFR